MLVSHDRAFLDNVTRRTIEISLGKIYDYKASWSKYLDTERGKKRTADRFIQKPAEDDRRH